MTHTISEEDLDNLLKTVPLTSLQANELEFAGNDNARGAQRRMMLLACQFSIEQMTELKRAKPETFEELKRTVNAYYGHVEGLVELADVAVKRVNIADKLNVPVLGREL
jgi:hypothetical protein